MTKVPDIYHYHEVLDRAFIIQTMIENLFEGHPVVMAHPKTLGHHVATLQEASAKLYQEASLIQDEALDH